MKLALLLIFACVIPARADAPIVYDATSSTWQYANPKATTTIEPGMKMAWWCDEGRTMSPESTRAIIGRNKLLPAAHPYAWFNPQESDLDVIIAKADARKAAGDDPFVILDFEHWSAEPVMYPRIAELLRYYKRKSGRPAGFYPGWLGVGAKHNFELVAWARNDGKPYKGFTVNEARRRELELNAKKAAVVFLECDFVAVDLYAHRNADLLNEDYEVGDALFKFYREYCVIREVIPFAGSHLVAVPGTPQIDPAMLPAYVRLLQRYSTRGRYILWGDATLRMHSLARMLMGDAINPQATQFTSRIDLPASQTSAILSTLAKATKASAAANDDGASKPKE